MMATGGSIVKMNTHMRNTELKPTIGSERGDVTNLNVVPCGGG